MDNFKDFDINFDDFPLSDFDDDVFGALEKDLNSEAMENLIKEAHSLEGDFNSPVFEELEKQLKDTDLDKFLDYDLGDFPTFDGEFPSIDKEAIK